jgi:hypothetical protein
MLLACEPDGEPERNSEILAVIASGACARARAVDGAAFPSVGYCGQRLGAVNRGVLSAAWTIRAKAASTIAQ